MPSSSTATFRKRRACPTSEMLLEHARCALRGARAERLARHLDSCDFCGAEMQLLSRFPPTANALPFVAVKLPEHLRRLAADLMLRTIKEPMPVTEALLEIERLTLTDA